MYLGCIKHKGDQKTIASVTKYKILRISQTFIDDFGFERIATITLSKKDLPKLKKLIASYEEQLDKPIK